MKDHFWTGWGRQLFSWYGFVFTVGGAIVGIILARDYWWVMLLIVLANSLACAGFAYQKHAESRQAKEEGRREVDSVQEELRRTSEQLQLAERKLNEIPSEMLLALQGTVAAYSIHELAGALRERLVLIRRLLDFTRAMTKKISLRKFVRQAGRLYVIAKTEPGAVSHILPGDPFVLVKQSLDGLETPCATLRVHQPPDLEKGVLHFEIVEALSDEMAHVERLAESVDVPKLKGYSVRVACDLGEYERLDLQNSEPVISRLVQTLLAEREGKA